MDRIKVTVWNENVHDKTPEIMRVYPAGIHGAIKQALDADGRFETVTATMDQEDQGLSVSLLDNTDVLFWWGHMSHHEVRDSLVQKVWSRVLDGMGLIVLHSGHASKIFKKLTGTTCDLKWRESEDKERVWVACPSHPIARGLRDYFELPHEETYGEHFDIPEPDETVFISWFSGGEVFRSGITYRRRNGKVFYFRPGHETFPTYYDGNVRKVLVNAAVWAAPSGVKIQQYGKFDSPERA